MTNARADFLRDGYVIVRDILSTEEIAHLRRHIQATEARGRVIQAPEAFGIAGVAEAYCNGRILSALRDIFGGDDLVFYPSYQIQVNSFTQSSLQRRGSGAHIDGIKEVELGAPYMRGATPPWVNIGLYLQDVENDGYGGGVEVLRRSHRIVRTLLALPFGRQLTKAYLKLSRRARSFTVADTRAGDALIFDNRLIHLSYVGRRALEAMPAQDKAVKHQQKVEGLPERNEKFGLYWFAGPAAYEQDVMRNNFALRVAETRGAVKSGGFDYEKACRLTPSDLVPVASRFAQLGKARVAGSVAD